MWCAALPAAVERPQNPGERRHILQGLAAYKYELDLLLSLHVSLCFVWAALCVAGPAFSRTDTYPCSLHSYTLAPCILLPFLLLLPPSDCCPAVPAVPVCLLCRPQAAERAESQRRAAAAAAQSKARQAAARSAANSRAPVAVIMSDKQREAVEGLVQELAEAADLLGPTAAAATAGSNDWGGVSETAGDTTTAAAVAAGDQQDMDEDLAEAASGFIEGLVRTGFSAADAAAAVKAVGPAAGVAAATAATAASAAAAAGGRRVTRVWRSHEGLQPYLDWLCIRLPVQRLPSRYRPGGWGVGGLMGSGVEGFCKLGCVNAATCVMVVVTVGGCRSHKLKYGQVVCF